MSQGEIVPPALPGDIFSRDEFTVRALGAAEWSRSLFCQGGNQDWGRAELGPPGASLTAFLEPSKVQLWLQSLPSLPLVYPGLCMGEAFAVPSPSAGVLEQQGCANYSFPGSNSFVLLSSPFPPGARWGRKGIWPAAEHERKREEKAWRPR